MSNQCACRLVNNAPWQLIASPGLAVDNQIALILLDLMMPERIQLHSKVQHILQKGAYEWADLLHEIRLLIQVNLRQPMIKLT